MKCQTAVICLLSMLGLIGEVGYVRCDEYPTRPVKFILPYGAGGTVDVQLRTLAAATETHLGQPIVVENRASSSGILAAEMTAAAAPDGYTITPINTNVLRVPFMTTTSYDPLKDFSYIIGISSLTSGIVVRSDSPWRTFAEFLEYARSNPGRLTYGGPSGGTNAQIVMLQIARKYGIEWTHVPYRSALESSTALRGGHIHAIADAAGWAPFVNSGEFRVLVTFGSDRTKKWPDVPSIREFDIEVAASSDYGIAGAPGLSSQIVRTLHDGLKKGMEEPRFTALLTTLAQEPVYRSTEDYQAYIREQIEIQRRVVRELDLKVR